MNVTSQRPRAPAPPLGVIPALIAGFETINTCLWLVLPPVMLDLFLWLGPRLSIMPLILRTLGLLEQAMAGPDAAALEPMLANTRLQLLALGRTFNLFAVLSTTPLGVPSLMAARGPSLTPWGGPLVWPVDSALVYLLLFGGFSVAGLGLGAAFFGGIAQQVRDKRLSPGRLLRQVWGDWVRLIALALAMLVVVGILGGPTLVLAYLFSLIHPVLGSLTSIVGATVILWALLFSAYTLPGIVLQRRGFFGAVWDSLRLVQVSLPQTTSLLLAVVLLNIGLGLVWNLAADDSWLMLVGIGAHGVVAASLIAGAFVFYQDRYRWWLETQQLLTGRQEA